MEYLGWANDRSKAELIDKKWDEARRNGWKIFHKNLGSCVEEVSCPEGDWYYHVDASD
jgi:hypothetical protein